METEILQYMIDNITDQNGSDESLTALMSAFELSTSEDYESRDTKLSLLYDIYGVDAIHLTQKWLML